MTERIKCANSEQLLVHVSTTQILVTFMFLFFIITIIIIMMTIPEFLL